MIPVKGAALLAVVRPGVKVNSVHKHSQVDSHAYAAEGGGTTF
jgi:hypothetical protein